MRESFKHIERCEGQEGAPGCEFESVGVCYACCAGGGCNYGTCFELRGKCCWRLFQGYEIVRQPSAGSQFLHIVE